MKTLKEKIEVMVAFEQKKTIEVFEKGMTHWVVDINPSWNWDRCDWRIAQPLKPVKVVKEIPVTINDAGYLVFACGISRYCLSDAVDMPEFRGYKWKYGTIRIDTPWTYRADGPLQHCDYVLMEVEE